MTIEFKLPLISEGVEAADIASVHVHEGDVIQAGQVLLEVETEKGSPRFPRRRVAGLKRFSSNPARR